jgi:hypothetical protein
MVPKKNRRMADSRQRLLSFGGLWTFRFLVSLSKIRSRLSLRRFVPPDQIIQPWMFGHGETKRTCLWLKGLPALIPTNVVSGREARIHRLPPTEDRWKLRSKTFTGVASAMAA